MTCTLLLLLRSGWPWSAFFFLNYTAPPEIYPLPLHDALPILVEQIQVLVPAARDAGTPPTRGTQDDLPPPPPLPPTAGQELRPLTPARRALVAALGRNQVTRSEEHTSELQSQSNLVCRLLLEK